MKMNDVHPEAKIAEGVVIENFTTIAKNVEIGAGTWVGPNVTIMDNVRIGENCKIFPGAVLGAIPQDLKFEGEDSWVEIGNNVTVREYVTINRGTKASGKMKTVVGNNCLLMSYTHIAHDCVIGNNAILASFTGLAGETEVQDHAILGGKTGTHQFVRIGIHAITSGGSLVGKDVPPFTLAGHYPLAYGGINRIGLRRRGFSPEKIAEIHDIYRIVYQSGLNTTDACAKIEETCPVTPERDLILNFIRSSKRGIIRGVNLDEE